MGLGQSVGINSCLSAYFVWNLLQAPIFPAFPKFIMKYKIICLCSAIGFALLHSPPSISASNECTENDLGSSEDREKRFCRIVDGEKIVRSLLTPLPGSAEGKTDCQKICEILKLE